MPTLDSPSPLSMDLPQLSHPNSCFRPTGEDVEGFCKGFRLPPRSVLTCPQLLGHRSSSFTPTR